MKKLAEAGLYVAAAAAGAGAYMLTDHFAIDNPERHANSHNAQVEYCIELPDSELVASDRCIAMIGGVAIKFGHMDRVDDHLEVDADVVRTELLSTIETPEDNTYTPLIAGIGAAGLVSAPSWVKRVNWSGAPRKMSKDNQTPSPVDRGSQDKV